jgi:hypothetical protein
MFVLHGVYPPGTGTPVQDEDAKPGVPAARSILFSFSIPVMDKFSGVAP